MNKEERRKKVQELRRLGRYVEAHRLETERFRERGEESDGLDTLVDVAVGIAAASELLDVFSGSDSSDSTSSSDDFSGGGGDFGGGGSGGDY